MHCIHKQILSPSQKQTIKVPKGAEFIDAGDSQGQLAIWYEFSVDEKGEFETEDRTIVIVGTGWYFEAMKLRHIRTVNIEPWVWHVYEKRE